MWHEKFLLLPLLLSLLVLQEFEVWVCVCLSLKVWMRRKIAALLLRAVCDYPTCFAAPTTQHQQTLTALSLSHVSVLFRVLAHFPSRGRFSCLFPYHALSHELDLVSRPACLMRSASLQAFRLCREMISLAYVQTSLCLAHVSRSLVCCLLLDWYLSIRFC